jgi:hypothetical protein
VNKVDKNKNKKKKMENERTTKKTDWSAHRQNKIDSIGQRKGLEERKEN